MSASIDQSSFVGDAWNRDGSSYAVYYYIYNIVHHLFLNYAITYERVHTDSDTKSPKHQRRVKSDGSKVQVTH